MLLVDCTCTIWCVLVYAYRDQAEIRRAFGWGWEFGGRHSDCMKINQGGSTLLVIYYLLVIVSYGPSSSGVDMTGAERSPAGWISMRRGIG